MINFIPLRLRRKLKKKKLLQKQHNNQFIDDFSFFFLHSCTFILDNRHRTQPISSTIPMEPKDVRATTLPRRRGNSSPAITSPTNSPCQQSPGASTPSVDSAVGSAEGLGINQTINIEEHRPRSDGSDSLATSSALTSPEPPVPDSQDIRIDIIQQNSNITNEQQIVTEIINQESNNEKIDHKGLIIYLFIYYLCSQKKFTIFGYLNYVESRIEPHEVIITPPPEEPRLSQASEASEAPSETPSSETSSPSGKIRRYRGDTSKRRKGVYITQWPEPSENDRNKLSAQSSEEKEDPPTTLSDVSDCEGHAPRR